MNCPFCAEEIKDAASVCRYCGRDLVSVRPLLDANAALSKQIDDLKQQFDALAEAQSQVHRHVGMGDGKIPSIHRASAVALLLVWVFVAGLFIAAVKQHGGELSLVYATSALIVVPMIFGFLCQNIKTRPAASDLGVALAVSTVALIEIQLIRWELLGGFLIPQGWGLAREHGDLPPDTWEAFIFNGATIFFSFSAGVFFRYLLQASHHDQVTVATPVSKFLVTRFGGQLSPAQIEEKIKRTDALIHSLSGIAATGGALATYLVSHVHNGPH
ncbi:MAG TPA: hypothetical protein VGR70_16120 [Stellaceae bacterium]|nr:hypothetical protein [Stellaceae bacterium]